MPRKVLKRKASSDAAPAAKRRSRPLNSKLGPRQADENEPTAITSNRACLNALPDELLLNILGRLKCCDPWCSSRSYRALALTNKHLYGLALEFLYESFDGWGHRPKFLRSLIANPELGGRVKRISWETAPAAAEGLSPYKPTSSDCRLLRSSLKDLAMPDRAAWVRLYASGQPEDMLKIALLHMPNIRDINVTEHCWAYHGSYALSLQNGYLPLLLNGVNGKPLGQSFKYEHLHTLRIPITGLKINDILTIFRVPTLRHLTLSGAHDAVTEQSEQSLLQQAQEAERFSGVTHLTMMESKMTGTIVALMITVCRQLKSLILRYDSMKSMEFTPAPIEVSYPTLHQALRGHKTCIEVIDIDDTTIGNSTIHGNDRIGSFIDFEKLEQLGMPFENIATGNMAGGATDFATILPDTIRRLDLSVNEEEEETHECYESVWPLLTVERTGLPNLEHINLRAHRCDFLGQLRIRDLWEQSGYGSVVRFTVERDGEMFEDEDFDDEEFDSESDLDFSEDDFGWGYGYDYLDGFDEDYWDPYDEDDMMDELEYNMAMATAAAGAATGVATGSLGAALAAAATASLQSGDEFP